MYNEEKRTTGNWPEKKKKLRATRLSDDFIAVMEPEGYVCPVQPADSYNGSAHDNFTWSQSISDLDVLVKVPAGLKNPDDLRVDLTAIRIKVEARRSVFLQSHDSPDGVAPQKANYPKAPGDPDEWTTILEGEFSFPTKKNESLWSLSPGECVNVKANKQIALSIQKHFFR